MNLMKNLSIAYKIIIYVVYSGFEIMSSNILGIELSSSLTDSDEIANSNLGNVIRECHKGQC